MLSELIAKHRTNGVLIDTNLLLLLIIGMYDRRRISSFKRTATYSIRDFQRIGGIAKSFDVLWTTPNIMTEVENLGRQLQSREWRGFAKAVASLFPQMREEYIPTASAIANPLHGRLGLADCATLGMKPPYLLISDDLDLYLEARRAGIDAINYNHIRNV